MCGFLQKKLSHTIQLPPIYFGRNIRVELARRLHEDVEGTCNGRVGYIVSVLEVVSITPGKLLPGSGSAEFKVEYQAIVFKPFKNQVMDAVVSTVNKASLMSLIGFLLMIAKDGLFCRSWAAAGLCFQSRTFFP
jgi:DNA-directed RNA polymerase II subunit RPB7